MNTPDKSESLKVTVRFVEDTGTNHCWFEEKLTNGQWAKIPETQTRCEGNTRERLATILERRRQARLMVFRKVGTEETFTIS